MTHTAPANTTRAEQLLLYALIASLPFTDFLQIGLVAFNAAPVMGELGASPEEYSGVATLYAVVAIGTIAMHRWLLERLGWRTLVQSSAALLALGAVVCGTAQRLPQFAMGRVLMALGCAAFLTVGRLLVNHIPPSPRRFTGIRFFASGLAWGGVAGPLLAASALAHANWRAGFFVLPVVAGLIALLASLAPIARPMHAAEHHSRYQPGSLLPLIGGSFLLLYALQRASFDYFSHATDLLVMALLALPALGLFAGLLARQRQPVLAARPLLTTRYLLGLAIFCVCYVVLGANNSMLPVLMQRALGLPLEVVGRYLGLG
ncbi:MAG: MFS transporter, partial [Rhodoferax sp.]